MNYRDLEKVPGICFKNHHLQKFSSLDLNRLDLENEAYSVITLSLEQSFSDMMNMNINNKTAFKNLFTNDSISLMITLKSFEYFFRIMTQRPQPPTNIPENHNRLVLSVHPKDHSFFKRYIQYEGSTGFQLARRYFTTNNENKVDYEFKEHFNRRMNESIFFTILHSTKKPYL